MRKIFSAALAAAVFAALFLAVSSYAKADGGLGEKWKGKLDNELRKEMESQNRGFSIMSAQEKSIDVIVTSSDKNLERFGTVKKKFSIIQAVSMSVPESGIERLARLDSVERIISDYRVSAFRIEAIPLIKADFASSDFGTNGTNVNISIIDTGVYGHIEFLNPNRIVQQKCFCAGCCQPNNTNSNNNATDDNGHGTHVTGAAAGEGNSSYGRGAAANASVFAVKVLDNNGGGYASDIISGIEWSVQNKAKIISMSLGLTYDLFSDCYEATLAEAVDSATEQGVLVVVAAGNSGGSGNKTIANPACAKRALAVGSVSDISDSISSFSSRGATGDNRTKPDLAAPGSPIKSTVPPDAYCTGSFLYKNCFSSEYNTLSGTSMAAPFVSGAAALVMEQYNKTFGYFPEPERVKAILLASANTSGMEAGFSGGGAPYRNNYYGSGRLDAYKSLQITNFTANGTIAQGQQKLFYFNVTNSNASVVLVWGENSTTYNNLDLIVGNGTNNFTAGADKNDTAEHIFLRNAGNGTWNIYVNGTAVSGPQKFFIASDAQVFSDAYPPHWSANSANPAPPANYSRSGNYFFNITWTDDAAVDEAVFEWNNATNYSFKKGNISQNGDVFYASLSDLTAGNYSFKWYANDTSGKWNSTAAWNYSVARANPGIALLLNSSAGNFTIASGDFVNATAYGGEGNISLYRNGSLAAAAQPAYDITNYSGSAGASFNITAFYNQTYNYTAGSATIFIIIDSNPPLFSNNRTSPQTPAPYGNSQFNTTVFDETNVSSVLLEWNGTANYTALDFSGSGSYSSAKEYYYSMQNIPVGNHAYRWLANDSMNNWNSSQNFSYSVVQAASRSRLFLNGTEGNATYTVGQVANISALANITGKNIIIFSNFSGSQEMIAGGNASSTSNTTNTSNLNASSVYNITSYFSGDENYTASSVSYYLGLCPVCPPHSDWSSCSGGSQSRTVYSCGASTNYQCGASAETQQCSSAPDSSGGTSYSIASTQTAKSVSAPSISVTSSGGVTTVSIPSVAANSRQDISITNSSLPIREISFFPSEASTNARLEMRIVPVPSLLKPEGEVFNYFSIEKTNISSRNSSDIGFFATKKWVSDNGINVSTVALNRLSGNWTRLPTAKSGEDYSNFYFKAATPGFSYFAITGEKIMLQQGQPENRTVAENNVAENKDGTAAKSGNSNLPAFIIAGGLAAALAVCLAAYEIRKGKGMKKDDKKEKESDKDEKERKN